MDESSRAWYEDLEYPPIIEELDGPGAIAFRVISFGRLHGEAPKGAQVVLDVRDALTNPPDQDSSLIEKTGLYREVREHVERTAGYELVVRMAVNGALGYYRLLGPKGLAVVVAIGCGGGRHRSVVIANAVARELASLQLAAVEVEHRDILRPVVRR